MPHFPGRAAVALTVCALAAAPLFAQAPGSQAIVKVPATANPYLAGMPRGTKARMGDRAPEQSPVLVELTLVNAVSVTFSATGAANHTPAMGNQFDPPDGGQDASHQGGAEHGIADLVAPIDSVVGVFLDDERPDRTRAPKGLNFRSAGKDLTLAPQLKQVFYIGSGSVRKRGNRKFLVPKGATRLFLGMMDGFEWNNNTGSFQVAVSIERTDVSSSMYSVDSRISFADWACLPDRSQCTPDRPVVKETASGRYHVVLPAHLEWGASIPTPPGASASAGNATGTVCLDSQSRSTSSCNGTGGEGTRAGLGYLAPDKPVGALISKVTGDRTYFSVNDRAGAAFQSHEGFFEFDVTVK
jgi:hypothetical protein